MWSGKPSEALLKKASLAPAKAAKTKEPAEVVDVEPEDSVSDAEA